LSSLDSKPPKISQPHGGALYAGGVPGNRGGGRPRSVATQRAEDTFDDVVRRIGRVIERRPDTCPPQFPTFAFNSSKKFSTTINSLVAAPANAGGTYLAAPRGGYLKSMSCGPAGPVGKLKKSGLNRSSILIPSGPTWMSHAPNWTSPSSEDRSEFVT